MDVLMPDGTTITGVPDGMTKAQLQQKLSGIRAPERQAQPSQQRPLTNDKPNFIDKAIINFLSDKPRLTNYLEGEIGQGSRFGRVVQGAADLPVGTMQLGMNLVGAGDVINPKVAEINAQTQARRGEDSGTFDPYRMLGAIVNPAPIMALSKLPIAATMLGKTAQGAGLGALFGAGAPVESDNDYWPTKVAQVGGGAALGGAIPPVAALASKATNVLRNVVDPLLPGGTGRSAIRLANKAAGARRQEIIDELLKDQEIVPDSRPNAGQAAVNARSVEFSALQRAAEARNPSEYYALERAQQEARQRALATVFGTKESLAAAEAERAANAAGNYGPIMANRVNPRSDVQIMHDAIAARARSAADALQTQGRYQTVAAQQAELAAGRGPRMSPVQTAGEPQINVGVTGGQARSPSAYPVEGQPRFPARYTDNAQRVPEARTAAADAGAIAASKRSESEYLQSTMNLLEQTVGMDSKPLNFFLSRPSMISAVHDAMKSARETGSYFPSKAGEQFSLQNLQRIKESLDAGIQAAVTAKANGIRPKLSPQELEGTRREFIKWLSNKSPDWRNARQAYAADSAPINQMKVGQYLQDKLATPMGNGERANVFASAVNDAPKTIQNAITGAPRYEKLSDVLTPKQVATVNAVKSDLARVAEYEALASKGGSEVARMTGENIPSVPPPGMFNPPLSAARSWANRLLRGATDEVMHKLAIEMRNPKKFAALMQSVNPVQRQQIQQAIVRYQGLLQSSLMSATGDAPAQPSIGE